MTQPKLPVFQHFRGPAEAPGEAWATRTLGYEGRPHPARHLAAWIDEVASGVETIAATPEFAHLAPGWRAARKGLSVAVPQDLLGVRDILAAAAHAVSLGVELALDIFPPGAPASAARPDPVAERWLRWQFTLPPGPEFGLPAFQSLLGMFDLFPLRFLSAPYLDEGRARPLEARDLLAAVSAPAGRTPTLTLSASEEWTQGDHLLLALVASGPVPYWVVAATLTDATAARADLIEGLDRLARRLLDADAHSGFLHPLGDLVWSNVALADTWRTAGRPLPPGPVQGGGPERLDVERLPGHGHVVDGVVLLPAALTWMGRGFLRHVTEARASAFADCEDNRPFGTAGRRVWLADPREGRPPWLAERQQAMRRALGLEPVAAGADRGSPEPLTGADLRHRLEVEQRARAATTLPRNATPPTSASAVRRGFTVRGPMTAVDAAMSLRFAVQQCTFDESGLVARAPDGSERRVAWGEIGSIVARQMPPDPPYDRVPFLDVVPGSGGPLRILAATRVNYADLPRGAAPIALENLRRLGRLVLERQPAVAVDPATRAFVEGRPPQAFAGLNQFSAYDGAY